MPVLKKIVAIFSDTLNVNDKVGMVVRLVELCPLIPLKIFSDLTTVQGQNSISHTPSQMSAVTPLLEDRIAKVKVAGFGKFVSGLF